MALSLGLEGIRLHRRDAQGFAGDDGTWPRRGRECHRQSQAPRRVTTTYAVRWAMLRSPVLRRAVGAHSTSRGVRVLGVNPGPTETDRLVTLYKSRAAQRFGDESKWSDLLSHLPFGRATKPERSLTWSCFLHRSGHRISAAWSSMRTAARCTQAAKPTRPPGKHMSGPFIQLDKETSMSAFAFETTPRIICEQGGPANYMRSSRPGALSASLS